MALRKSFLLGLATTLLVALTEQSAIAFTITPTQPGANGNYNPLAPYNLSDGTGETFLDTYLLCIQTHGGMFRVELPKLHEVERGVF